MFKALYTIEALGEIRGLFVGVGKLMNMAVTLGKQVRPELHARISGEHGGDPSSALSATRSALPTFLAPPR